jgi:signal transduction histidine kinase
MRRLIRTLRAARVSRWWAPSLTRRLVVAQLALTALLWVAALAWLNASIKQEEEAITLGLARRGAEAVFSIVQAAREQPAALADALARIDAYQRAFIGVDEDEPARTLPKLLVWDDGRSVYRSADAPAESADAALPAALDSLAPVDMAGRPMRAYARSSTDGRTRFLALLPSAAESSGFTPWSRGILVLPLLLSIPLLALPAWLSVRLALRPWRRLSEEITAREPNDLDALRFRARHAELAPLMTSINGLLARLRRGQERERSFIADAAHELRTPLAATRMAVDALVARPHGPQAPALLETLVRSSERSSRVVSQLLSLMRAESATEPADMLQFELTAFVRQCLADHAERASRHGVELRFDADAPIAVAAQAQGLASIIDNLIDNAIK